MKINDRMSNRLQQIAERIFGQEREISFSEIVWALEEAYELGFNEGWDEAFED